MRMETHNREMRYIRNEEVADILDYQQAFVAVEQSFIDLSNGEAVNHVRLRSSWENSLLNVMWAIAPKVDLMGVKSYPIITMATTRGVSLNILLYSAATGVPLCMLEADTLGQIRTGCASAVASSRLANPNPKSLSIIGTGLQSVGQARAHLANFPSLETLSIIGRSEEKMAAVIEQIQDEYPKVNIVPDGNRSSLKTANIIITATTAKDPVLSLEEVSPGTHINAMGSNMNIKRELPREILEKAAIIAVDERSVAAQESGDLAVNEWSPEDTVNLGDILTEKHIFKRDEDDITVFLSQGLAIQDLYAADIVLKHADFER